MKTPAEFSATVTWHGDPQAFATGRYSRAHTWGFDGGAVVPGSSSPLSVPLPFSDAAAVDPEEALVAAVSSCHMLFFLGFAAKKRWTIARYIDEARGIMEVDERGRLSMTRIFLSPTIRFEGRAPAAEDVAALHHEAHEACYIANSIRAEVVVEAI